MNPPAQPALTVLTAAEVAEVIAENREMCLDLVRRAYLTHHAGQSTLPHSSFLRFPDKPRDRIIALPAYLGGEFDVSGVKWIASYPENVASGRARASAVLILNSTATGFAYAVLEASLISATRTAASAVLGAELLLGARQAARVGIVGTGLIARHVCHFLRELGWRIGGFRLYDTRAQAAATFGAELRAAGATDVSVVPRPAEAFEGCPLVVLATVAPQPHLHDARLLAHAPVVLHLSLRDLAPELVLDSQNITDDVTHAVREGTSLELACRRAGDRSFIAGTVADLLTGRLTRESARPAVFSPFGLGVLDLAVGQWVYQRAVAAGRGTAVPRFAPS